MLGKNKVNSQLCLSSQYLDKKGKFLFLKRIQWSRPENSHNYYVRLLWEKKYMHKIRYQQNITDKFEGTSHNPDGKT